MSTITVEIKFYGAFRVFGECLGLELPVGSSIVELKQALTNALGNTHQSLVEDSVLANDQQVLPNHYRLQTTTTLSILPPVCGG